ncbi:MAG: hypothetical protein L0206_05045 [Actinobacteria bacterium]|nr:hypothetical protein [Actinomycetota bacterium]
MIAMQAMLWAGGDAHATEIGSDRAFGLGIQLGEPSGITGKVYLDGRSSAIDFLVGSYYDDGFVGDVYLQAAYHIHIVELTSGGGVTIPFRAGIGGFFNSGYWRFDDSVQDVVFGARVPIGLDFDLEKAPVQFYLEVALDVAVIPFVGIGGDGGLGARYYF